MPRKTPKTPSRRNVHLRIHLDRRGGGAGVHHTRERDVAKGRSRKVKHPHRRES